MIFRHLPGLNQLRCDLPQIACPALSSAAFHCSVLRIVAARMFNLASEVTSAVTATVSISKSVQYVTNFSGDDTYAPTFDRIPSPALVAPSTVR